MRDERDGKKRNSPKKKEMADNGEEEGKDNKRKREEDGTAAATADGIEGSEAKISIHGRKGWVVIEGEPWLSDGVSMRMIEQMLISPHEISHATVENGALYLFRDIDFFRPSDAMAAIRVPKDFRIRSLARFLGPPQPRAKGADACQEPSTEE